MAGVQYNSPLSLLLTAIYAVITGCLMIIPIVLNMLIKPKKFLIASRRDSRPDVLSLKDLGDHHYARLKHIRLHYVAKGPEGRPLVLLLHGFPEMWYSWRHQLTGLSKNYRVVALDMRGFGESDKPGSVAEYHMDKLTDDILEFMHHIGYERCHLVGHDWGGGVAWMFACKYPYVVEKLICCNMPHPIALQKHIKTRVTQMLKSWYMFLFQLPWLPEWYLGTRDIFFLSAAFRPVMKKKPEHFSREDLEAFKYSFKTHGDRTGGLNYYRAYWRYAPPAWASQKVQAPTLIIWGREDLFLEAQTAEQSVQYVNNRCTIQYLEHTTHWVQQEEPELVNTYIIQFLNDKLY